MVWKAEHHEEHVVGPTPIFGFAVLRIGIDGRLVSEHVAELVESSGFFIIQCQRKYAQLWKVMQFVGLGNAVVVFVNP